MVKRILILTLILLTLLYTRIFAAVKVNPLDVASKDKVSGNKQKNDDSKETRGEVSTTTSPKNAENSATPYIPPSIPDPTDVEKEILDDEAVQDISPIGR